MLCLESSVTKNNKKHDLLFVLLLLFLGVFCSFNKSYADKHFEGCIAYFKWIVVTRYIVTWDGVLLFHQVMKNLFSIFTGDRKCHFY